MTTQQFVFIDESDKDNDLMFSDCDLMFVEANKKVILKIAMNEELQATKNNNTQKLNELLISYKTVGAKWMYKT